MIDFSSNIKSALSDSSIETAWLVSLVDSQNTIRLTSWVENLIVSNETYNGGTTLLGVTPPDGAVINTGGIRDGEVKIYDSDARMFACVQNYIETPVIVTCQILFINDAMSVITIFAGHVRGVSLSDSSLLIRVGSKLDLQRSNPVYLTDQAQKQRKAGDNSLNQLKRDIYIDWRN